MTQDISNCTIYLAPGKLDLPDDLSVLRESLLTCENEVVLQDGSSWRPPKPAKYTIELFGENIRRQYFGDFTSSRLELVLPHTFLIEMNQPYTLALGHTDFMRVGHFMVRRYRPAVGVHLDTHLSLSDIDGLFAYREGRRSPAV